MTTPKLHLNLYDNKNASLFKYLLHLNDKNTLFAEVNINQLKTDKIMALQFKQLKININQIKGSEKLKMA